MTKGRGLEAGDIIVNHRERRGAEYTWLPGSLTYHGIRKQMKKRHTRTHRDVRNAFQDPFTGVILENMYICVYVFRSVAFSGFLQKVARANVVLAGRRQC